MLEVLLMVDDDVWMANGQRMVQGTCNRTEADEDDERHGHGMKHAYVDLGHGFRRGAQGRMRAGKYLCYCG
jgi:hypothetical protein